MINALSPDPNVMPQGGSALAQTQPPAPPPPPNHQQTVTALRHFHAIESGLTTLLKDPSLGKSDIKSRIIDEVTALVARGIFTPATAVTQLGTVPDKPFDQRKWLEDHLKQTTQVADMVLMHHQAGFGGQNVDTTTPNMDNHTVDANNLITHYKGKKNG